MPDALARLAMANFELGSITYELGDKEDALQALEGSLAIRERLAREIPGLPQFASELAASLNFIGRVKTDLGRLPEALTAHEQAHAIRERLRENPKATSFQRDLAWSLNNIASVYSAMGRSAEAIESYERSRTIFERLAREPQGNSQSDRSCLVSRQHRRPGREVGPTVSGSGVTRAGSQDIRAAGAKSRRSFRWSMTLFRLITASETCSARWVDPPMRWRRTSRPARSSSERGASIPSLPSSPATWARS